MATERQIAANRRNSQKSTGPRTPEGKAAVRLNAVTHGLLARAVCVDTGDGREDPEEFAVLVDSLVEDLQPAGPLQRMMVERMAAAHWRAGRAARAESEALRRALNDVGGDVHDVQEENENALRRDLVELERPREAFKSESEQTGLSAERLLHLHQVEILRRLRKNPAGVDHLIYTVERTVTEITETHALGNRILVDLVRLFQSPESLFERIRAVLSPRNEVCDSTLTFSPGERKAVLNVLKGESATLKTLQQTLEMRRAESLQAERNAVTLPSDEDVQRIQRYEVMYDRQFYQAMNQLERLQRRRSGEPSLPPITVTVEQVP